MTMITRVVPAPTLAGRLVAALYGRLTGRPYWIEARPVDLRGTLPAEPEPAAAVQP